MTVVPFDETYDPPAPVVPLLLRAPGSDDWVQVIALVDTGADVTLVPDALGERHLPVAGAIEVEGVTGAPRRVPLYRAEVAVGGLRAPALVAGLGSAAVVGRDLLNRLTLTLDGPSQALTI